MLLLLSGKPRKAFAVAAVAGTVGLLILGALMGPRPAERRLMETRHGGSDSATHCVGSPRPDVGDPRVRGTSSTTKHPEALMSA